MAILFASYKSFKNRAAIFILLLFLQIGISQENVLDSLKLNLQRIENASNFDKKDTSYINLLNKLAKQYYFKNVDSLYYFSNKAYKLSNTTSYIEGEIIALTNISYYNFYIGKKEKALDVLNNALEIAKEKKNVKLEIRVLNSMGIQQYDLGNHSEALKAYLNAIDLATDTNDIVNLSFLKENVGHLYLTQKDYKQSLELYKEVEALNKQLGNVVYTAESKSNIADLYVKLNDFKNATAYINSSIETFEEKKILDWLAYSYQVKGDIYLKQKKSKIALHWYDKALNIHKNINDDISKATLLNGLSEVYYQLGNYEEADKNALSSLEISNRLGLLDDTKNSVKLLYEINKQNNLPDIALKYHEQYKLLSDSISRKENLNSLGILKTKLEFDKQQKDTILANDKEIAKQNIYIYLSLVALAILGLIVFLLKKQSKTRKIFNNELRLKTKALEKREEELNAINNTKDKLFSIIGHDLRGPINALGSILTLLRDKEIKQDEFLRFVPKLKNDVDAISFTLNNLLSWGKTQIKGSTIEQCDVDLSDLISNNIKLLHEIANNKAINIKNNIPSDTTVWADKNQIDVVIRNLLNNALKFTNENGEISFKAEKVGNYIQVSVTDNGVGLKPETQKQIFSKQNTLITTYGTANEKGTGLGLSLCKEMIENNGGKIWVESIFGLGSTFYFKLPQSSAIKKAI
tara:strand:- start:1586 stop:3661 length:2076 start_codon:yes stop_codon:yes gene_type:complete